MTATTRSEDQPRNPDGTANAADAAQVQERPVVSLIAGASTDRCPVCSAELAVDQHYCVECGTRRGKPRFAVGQRSAASSELAVTAPARPGLPVSANVALGLVILLLALGVGVLIGHDGKSTVVIRGSAAAATSGTGKRATYGSTATGGSSKSSAPPTTSTTSNFFPSS